MAGLSTPRFFEALRAEGVRAGRSGYVLLHRLLLFEKGFDIFTRNRGPLCGDYQGYKQGDLPVSEEVHQRIVFLPCFTDPLEGLAEQHLEAIHKVAGAADRLAAAAT
jgi:dTDP-4-amino-4,6-dideoxygalactose transaminase